MINFLWKKEPFELQLEIPASLILRKLKIEVSPKPYRLMGSERISGEVDENKIKIKRHMPLVHNPFKPVMVAEFSDLGERCVLKGEFRMDRLSQVFVSLWFGLILFSLFMTTATILAETEYPRSFPWHHFLMLAAGVAIVSVSRWSARNDKDWLINKINKVSVKR